MRTSRRIEGASEEQGERLIRILSAATFLIFFQAYMIAPLIPKLADVFHVSAQTIGVAVPAYMIPYGAATLFYGIVSDRVGRRPIILGSLALFVALTTLTALARSGGELVFWRLLTGIGASGVVPIGLALMGDLFPYEKRGRPLGWLFGAMAGGMAFGSTFGVLLEPIVGWRSLFVGVGGLARNADLHLCARQRDLPFRGLHVAGVVFCSALSPRRDRHRAGAVGVWRSGIHFRARHWKGCGPLGPALDDSGRTGNCGACGWGAYIPPTDSGCGADGDCSLARV